jgi:hypothetical protein
MGVPEKSGIPFYPRNTTRNRGLPTKLIVMENIGIFTDEMARSIYVFPTQLIILRVKVVNTDSGIEYRGH